MNVPTTNYGEYAFFGVLSVPLLGGVRGGFAPLVVAAQGQENVDRKVNPLVLQAFASAPPASMGDVAKRCGELLVKTHAAWRDLLKKAEGDHAPTPEGFPDENQEELAKQQNLLEHDRDKVGILRPLDWKRADAQHSIFGLQQHVDPLRDAVRAQCGHADAEIHGVAVFHFTCDAAGDDLSFGDIAHGSASFNVGPNVRPIGRTPAGPAFWNGRSDGPPTPTAPLGRHIKICRRLGVSPAPEVLKGPVMLIRSTATSI